jgi:hypothetical protein
MTGVLGHPATGKDPLGCRPHLIAEVDPCAAATETSRSDAIRRLVELGLKKGN